MDNEKIKSLKFVPKKAKLYIMCGLPFSGKSYAGRKIAEMIGGEFVSYDSLWNEINTKEGRNPSWEEISEIAQKRIRYTLKDNKSVIYDTLNDTVGNRDLLRSIAAEQGKEAITVYMNTPIDVIRERQRQNELTRDRHPVNEEMFVESLDRFEQPVSEKNVIEVMPETILEDIFKN